jgi:hypothetical protein
VAPLATTGDRGPSALTERSDSQRFMTVWHRGWAQAGVRARYGGAWPRGGHLRRRRYSHDGVVDEMGVRVPRGVTNNTQLESYCLLVFRGGDRMVAWTLVSRNVAECSVDDGTGVHSADEARFGADTFRPAAND